MHYISKDFRPGTIIKYVNMNEDLNGMLCIVEHIQTSHMLLRRYSIDSSPEHDIARVEFPLLKSKIKIISW
jgi:hypothetical protein